MENVGVFGFPVPHPLTFAVVQRDLARIGLVRVLHRWPRTGLSLERCSCGSAESGAAAGDKR